MVRSYVNGVLAGIPGHYGKVADIDLNLLFGSYICMASICTKWMQILKSNSSISRIQVSRFKNAWIKANTNVVDRDVEYRDARELG